MQLRLKIITFTFLCLLNTSVYSEDLIFLNGFDHSALVSGTATGIISSGLELRLTATNVDENIEVINNGTFSFSSFIIIGDLWNVEILSHPIDQSCTLKNSSGVMSNTDPNSLEVICLEDSNNWDEMNWEQGDWQ